MKNSCLYKTAALLSVIGFITAPHLAHADITSNLLIHYTMEDNAANTTVVDSQGLSNGTANVNTNTLSSTGKFNNGMLFSTTTGQSIDTNYAWSASDPNFTISAWVKTSATGDNYSWISSYEGQPGILSVGTNVNGFPACGVGDTSSNSMGTSPSSVIINDNLWHLETCVVSGTTLKLYVDGVLFGTDSNPSFTGVFRDINSYTLKIARNGSGYTWAGKIDDVRIYNRALSQADITELAGLDAYLFGWWKFDEGSGTTAADSSGNGNTGTLGGTTVPSWTTGKIGPYAINNTVGIGGSGGYVSSTNTSPGFHQDLTLSAWVYPTDLTGQSGANIFLSGSNVYYVTVSPAGDFTFTDRIGTQHTYAAGVPLNTWTMLTATCHDTGGTADVVTLYVNGTQVKQDVGGSGDLFCYDNFPNIYYVGGYAPAPGSYGFTGYVDDARVYYGRALSSTDVTALYALGSPPAPPPAAARSFMSKVGRLFTVKLGKRFQF